MHLSYNLRERVAVLQVAKTQFRLLMSASTLPSKIDELSKRIAEVLHLAHENALNVDECTDVVHLVFKSFSSPYKYRDFCLLRAWKRMSAAAMAAVAAAAQARGGRAGGRSVARVGLESVIATVCS